MRCSSEEAGPYRTSPHTRHRPRGTYGGIQRSFNRGGKGVVIMQTYRTAAVLLGGIFLGPTPTATGQTTNRASATVPTSEYVVFLDNGTNRLSSAAIDTIRIASGAARSAA